MDSAGVAVEYLPILDVQFGMTVASGWRPFVIVDRVEHDGIAEKARMHFVGGHIGGWCPLSTLVPCEVAIRPFTPALHSVFIHDD